MSCHSPPHHIYTQSPDAAQLVGGGIYYTCLCELDYIRQRECGKDAFLSFLTEPFTKRHASLVRLKVVIVLGMPGRRDTGSLAFVARITQLPYRVTNFALEPQRALRSKVVSQSPWMIGLRP